MNIKEVGDEFVKGFRHVVERLGLAEYGYDFEIREIRDKGGVLARCITDPDAMYVCIHINNDLSIWEDHSPYWAGVHEAFHVLTACLFKLSKNRYTTEDELWREEERIVRRLEAFVRNEKDYGSVTQADNHQANPRGKKRAAVRKVLRKRLPTGKKA